MRAHWKLSLAALAITACCARAEAQTLLRWKLNSGDALVVSVEQHTESQVAFSGKVATTKIDLDLDLAWNVASANDQRMVIRQTVERIKLKLTPPAGTNVEYDSASTTRLTGQAREMADALKPLVGAEFELEMNARGEIVNARPINDSAKSLFAGSEKAAEQNKTSTETIERLLRQSIVILPEKQVAVGDQWTTTSELATAAGQVKQETTYQLDGMIEQDGESLYGITSSATLTKGPASAKAKSPLTIKSNKLTGKILFSQQQGRVVEAEQTQELITERSYRETTITVTLTSTQKIFLKPR